MQEIINFLITPIIGGIIGYSTNWLAIKMLFRPHTEKHIFGVRIPFTPGLFPKNRYTLSKNIADTVGEHLLTADVLKESISGVGITEKISELIDNFISGIKANENTLSYYLGDKREIFIQNGSSFVSKIIKDIMNSGDFKIETASFVNTALTDFLRQKKFSEFSAMALENSKLFLEDLWCEHTDDFRVFSNNYLDKLLVDLSEKDYLLKDILSEDKSEAVKNFLYHNSDKLADIIRNFLDSNPDIELKIKNLIENILADNFGRFLSLFINENKIYYKIKDGIIDYLTGEENKPILFEQINKIIDDLMDRRLNSFIEKVDISTINSIKERIINSFASPSPELTDTVFNFIIEKAKGYSSKSLYDVILKIKPDYDIISLTYLQSFIESASKEILRLLDTNIPIYMQRLLDTKLDVFVSRIDQKAEDDVKKYLLSTSDSVLAKAIVYISENMNIRKIVEERINSFEVADTEEIILSVVGRELKAITALGGILGFLIAFIPQLF